MAVERPGRHPRFGALSGRMLDSLVERGRGVWAHPRYGAVVKAVVAYVLLVEVAIQIVFGKLSVFGIQLGRYDLAVPRGEIIGGAVIGVLYALVGMGIILVYRANRIINFAQAQLGAVPAVVALLLIAKHGWPYLAAIPVMLVGAVVLGASVEVLFVRRFSSAPRLILTVVTIGIGLLLVVLEFYSKQWVGGDLIDTLSLTFPTPFQSLRFHIGPSTLTGDHLFAVIVVAVLVVALGAFFRFTDIGIAVRASAENAERASLLGIPVKRVSTIVWILAALLSAVGVFLRTPLVGLPLQGSVGPSILLFGLAVAVIARMESLPMAFAGGILIGVIDRAALFATRRAALANAVMFLVVVIALLAQRGKLSRAMDTGVSTWQVVKEIRPTPAELRNLWEVRAARIGVTVVAGGLAIAGPWIFGAYKTSAATLIVLYAMIGVSLVILTGWAGQISLGQYAISGVGAAVAGGLAANHGWDFFGALFTGALAGAVVAVIVGLPALRIQGLFLAVTTLAFAFTVQNFILRREFFAWLVPKDNHFADRPVLYERWDLTQPSEVLGVTVDSDAKFYFVCLAFLVVVLAMARSLRQLRSGRVLIGVRDNGRVMQAFGVSLASTRLAAFAVSGFIAGLAGALLAYQNVVFSPGAFSPEQSIALFVMAVTGGVGSLLGAVLGALYIVGVPLLPGLRDVELIDLLTSGVGVLVVLLFLPGGFAEGAYRIRDWFLRKVAGRHGVMVASLVADVRVVEPSEEDELILGQAAEHVAEVEAEEETLVGSAGA
ncbi:MAG TPA: ABC transporter permease [Acidimicrobiales bacterium]|nr:ABC transporter permease [Acidimicrobiales bacterium]